MDFYTSEYMAQAETQRRITELQRLASRSVASDRGDVGDNGHWTSRFPGWITSRANSGPAFTARTPMNP